MKTKSFEYREPNHSETIGANSFELAVEEGKKIAAEDCYHSNETVWVSATVVELDAEEEVIQEEHFTVEIEPQEPGCSGNDHNWQ